MNIDQIIKKLFTKNVTIKDFYYDDSTDTYWFYSEGFSEPIEFTERELINEGVLEE